VFPGLRMLEPKEINPVRPERCSDGGEKSGSGTIFRRRTAHGLKSLLAAGLWLAGTAAAGAQQPGYSQNPYQPGQPAPQQSAPTMMPPPSPMPVPNELELAKMIWSTMAAVDHANQAGNYSVLRDLSAPAFQMENDSAKLAKVFESLRASNVDLSNTMLLAPTYANAPVIMPGNVLHVKGYFGLRPTAIGFDLYYQWLQGKWRLFGVSIVPASIASIVPGPAPTPGPAPAPSSRSQPQQGR